MAEFSQQAKQIFNEARKLSPEQRGAYVDASCARDADLRAQVEALLGAYIAAGSFLESPTFEPLTASPGDATRPSREESPGTVIGRYKLLQPIGEGGFGRVFMAEQTEPVQRRVALKIIKLGMDTRQVIARFEAERQALAMMDHPNIAKVLDAGATPEGRPFFVMELVRGEPITEYCDKNNLDVPQRLELFSQVCNAVQHAHQKGIIHRDIKPTNVLVTMADGKAVPKVIDFGIAKATSARLTEKTLFTEFRHLIGTPAYMSPEQAEASGVDIDTRSDIYSLGVLLYELLTGTTPFDAKRLHSAAYAEIQRIIREEEPPKPSTRLSTLETLPAVAAHRHTEPAKLSRTIRGDLDWIVMKCLEKDRTRRYETANALAMDIQRHLSDEPVLAGPPGSIYRIHKFVRKHRIGVLATGAIAAVLVLGVSGTTWGMLKANREAKRASEAANVARDAQEAEKMRANELEQVAAFQAAQFEGIDPELAGVRLRAHLIADVAESLQKSGLSPELVANQRRTFESLLAHANPTDAATGVIYENILATAATAAEVQFREQPLVKARLLQTIATALQQLGRDDQAILFWNAAFESRRAVLGEDHPDTMRSKTQVGWCFHNQGNYVEAERYFFDALERQTRVLGQDHPDRLNTLNLLGWLRRQQFRLDEAESYVREALDRRKRVLGNENRETLSTIDTLGWILAGQYKPEAEWCFREALEGRRRVLGADHRSTLASMYSLGTYLTINKRYEEAEPYLLQCLDGRRRALGDNHPATAITLREVAQLRVYQGKLDDAELLLREALAIMRSAMGEDHGETIRSTSRMGQLLHRQGKLAEAEVHHIRALDGHLRLLGSEHRLTFGSRYILGKFYIDTDRRDDAVRVLREWIDLQVRQGQRPEATAAELNEVAWNLLEFELSELQDAAKALPLAERACNLEEASGGSLLWNCLDTLALAQHRTGNTALAIQTLRRAISLMPATEPQTTKDQFERRLKEFEGALSPTPSTQPNTETDGGAESR